MSGATPAITRFTKYEDLPQLLTPEEFGIVAAVGRTAVYDGIRRGEIEHVRFGKLLRIPKAALAAIQGRRT